MSEIYTDNFWKGYDIIYEHYTKRREQFNKLYYLFSKLSTLYSNFGDELIEVFKEIGLDEEIIKEDSKGKNSFEDDLNKFYSNIWKEAKGFQELGRKIQDKIISEQFKNIIFTNDLNTIQGNPSNFENLYFKQVEEDYQKGLEKLEESKKQFQTKIDKKINEIVNPSSLNFLKSKVAYSPTDTLTNEYIISLIETEKKRKDYISKYTMLLDYYYNTELTFIKKANSSFNMFSDYINCLWQGLTIINCNWENRGEIYMQEFVDKNKTIGLPPFQLDFMNYTVEAGNLFPNQSNQKDQEKKMQSIQDYMKEVSDYVYPILNDNKKEISIYTDKLFNGEFSKDDFDTLIQMFNSKDDSKICLKKDKSKNQAQNMEVPASGVYEYVGLKNQMSFLGILNNKRTKTFEVPISNFEHFVKIFQTIIRMNEKSKDFELVSKIVGWCIILSQTFKKTVNNNSVYIQEFIQDEAIFKDIRFWINLCKHYIGENFYKSKHFTDFEVTLDEKDVRKIRAIAQSKLMTVAHNLTAFKVSEKIRDEVVNYLTDLYSINKEDVPFLIEEKVENLPINENKKEDVISNEIQKEKNENVNQKEDDSEKNNEKDESNNINENVKKNQNN